MSATLPATGERRGSAAGVAITGACFVGWGLYPFYFKALAAVGAYEVVAHRILWSAVLLGCLLPFGGAARELLATLRRPRRAATLVLTGYLILTNWTLYVVAVQNGQVLDASLGYFLGPLISVALGVLVLGERLSRVQVAAVLLAALAIANLVWQLGIVPKVALVLGTSFSVYGLVRKQLPVGPVVGLFVECVATLPVALAIFAWTGMTSGLASTRQGPGTVLLLLAAGVVTVGPLILFNMGAKRINYATVGVMQYIAPSMLFLESVLVFGEPLSFWQLVTFALIWAALAMYTGNAVWRARIGVAPLGD